MPPPRAPTALSPRARAMLAVRGDRSSDLTCARATLAARLLDQGLPVYEAVLDFEEQLGGITFTTVGSAQVTLGTWAMLRRHDPVVWTREDLVLVGDFDHPAMLLYMSAEGKVYGAV